MKSLEHRIFNSFHLNIYIVYSSHIYCHYIAVNVKALVIMWQVKVLL